MEREGCLSVDDRHPSTGTIYLERHHPVRRMHRYYRLTVEPNLFREWSLVREWGRIGKPSRSMIDLHGTEQDAQAAMARKEHEKRRRGYGPFIRDTSPIYPGASSAVTQARILYKSLPGPALANGRNQPKRRG